MVKYFLELLLGLVGAVVIYIIFIIGISILGSILDSIFPDKKK